MTSLEIGLVVYAAFATAVAGVAAPVAVQQIVTGQRRQRANDDEAENLRLDRADLETFRREFGEFCEREKARIQEEAAEAVRTQQARLAEIAAEARRQEAEVERRRNDLMVEEEDIADLREKLRLEKEAYDQEMKDAFRFHTLRYKVFIIGQVATGKTTLARCWINPMIEPEKGNFGPTIWERYDTHVVTHVDEELKSRFEHRIDFFDFGGEHFVQANEDLIEQQPEAIVWVLDLATHPDGSLNEKHVEQQIENIKHILPFFLTGKGAQKLRKVCFVINKVDLTHRAPPEARSEGLRALQPLRQHIDTVPAFRGIKARCVWEAVSVNQGIGARESWKAILEVLPEEAIRAWDQPSQRGGAGA